MKTNSIKKMVIITISLIIINTCLIIVNVVMIGKEIKESSNKATTENSDIVIPSTHSLLNEKERPLSEAQSFRQRKHPEQLLGKSEDDNATIEQQIPLSFTLDLPKIENKGEDAPPLFIASDNGYAIGVFDGMGGAGAEVYQENDQKHTGAYYASRTAKDVIEQFVLKDNAFNNEEPSNFIKEKLKNSFQKKRESLKGSQSGLVSKMIKTFPTTMAVSFILKKDNKWQIKVLWTGDSRVYLLLPNSGLVQLTKDDLSVDQDPFQNLYDDSSLSNMVNLSQDFTINFKTYETELPCVVLAASDGCFGYLPSPMHFEELLLETMLASNSINEWKQLLIGKLKEVSSDDCSMSLISSNIDFETLKCNFNTRYLFLSQEIQDINNEVKEMSENTENKNVMKEVCEKHWNTYKLKNYPF